MPSRSARPRRRENRHEEWHTPGRGGGRDRRGEGGPNTPPARDRGGDVPDLLPGVHGRAHPPPPGGPVPCVRHDDGPHRPGLPDPLRAGHARLRAVVRPRGPGSDHRLVPPGLPCPHGRHGGGRVDAGPARAPSAHGPRGQRGVADRARPRERPVSFQGAGAAFGSALRRHGGGDGLWVHRRGHTRARPHLAGPLPGRRGLCRRHRGPALARPFHAPRGGSPC